MLLIVTDTTFFSRAEHLDWQNMYISSMFRIWSSWYFWKLIVCECIFCTLILGENLPKRVQNWFKFLILLVPEATILLNNNFEISDVLVKIRIKNLSIYSSTFHSFRYPVFASKAIRQKYCIKAWGRFWGTLTIRTHWILVFRSLENHLADLHDCYVRQR